MGYDEHLHKNCFDSALLFRRHRKRGDRMAGAADPWNSSCQQVFVNHAASLASFWRAAHVLDPSSIASYAAFAESWGSRRIASHALPVVVKSFQEDIEWAFTMVGYFRECSTL